MRNRRRTRAVLLVLLPLAACGWSLSARADLIKLKNGGELRGQIVGGKNVAKNDQIEIVTLSGGRITVDRGKIQFVARRPHLVEVYETRARQTPDTIPAQWELAEWCRLQGVTLKQQRANHLRRIIRIDPEHKRAHAALKHTKRNGVWMTYDEARTAEGYVKHKGRYITPQELELIEKTQAELDAEKAWFRQVRLWKNWITGRHQKRRQAGHAKLTAIEDPYAVAALKQNFHDEENPLLRQFYVQILAQIPGDKPVPPLVDRALFDPNYQIRYGSLNALSTEQFPAATKRFASGLDDKSNEVVRRAGSALGRVADEQVVPDLIDALVTTHRYRVRVPANSQSLNFNSNGSFANSGQGQLPADIELMLRGGQFPNGVIVNDPSVNQLARTKVVKVKYDHQNSEVLAALHKLTGVDYGYNERNWRLWWTAKKNGTAGFAKTP